MNQSQVKTVDAVIEMLDVLCEDLREDMYELELEAAAFSDIEYRRIATRTLNDIELVSTALKHLRAAKV